MNIGVAKVNKRMTLDPTRWSHKGGENLHCTVIKYLCDTGHTVSVLTPADIAETDRLKYRPLHELDRPYSDWNDLDAVVVFAGAMANDCNATRSFRRMIMPTVNYLNESMVPWLYVLPDPRYWPRWLEMENRPRAILTQIEETFKCNLNYEEAEFRHTYAGVEKWQFYGAKPDRSLLDGWSDRPMDIVVAYHEHGRKEDLPDKDPAWRMMDSYPGPYEVYGEWRSRTGPQYKGIIGRHEVHQALCRGRSTFLVPIAFNWVTPKFYEACLNGTVPLLHSDSSVGDQVYDGQHWTGIMDDHRWRVRSADELVDRVRSLTKDDAADAQLMLTEDMTSGQVIERELVDRLRNPPSGNDPLIKYKTGFISLKYSALMTIEQTGCVDSLDLRRAVITHGGTAERWWDLVKRVGLDEARAIVQRVAMNDEPGSIEAERHVPLEEYFKRKIQ